MGSDLGVTTGAVTVVDEFGRIRVSRQLRANRFNPARKLCLTEMA